MSITSTVFFYQIWTVETEDFLFSFRLGEHELKNLILLKLSYVISCSDIVETKLQARNTGKVKEWNHCKFHYLFDNSFAKSSGSYFPTKVCFLKAILRNFYIFHQKKAFKNHEKYFLFYQKSSFHSQDIQFFCTCLFLAIFVPNVGQSPAKKSNYVRPKLVHNGHSCSAWRLKKYKLPTFLKLRSIR